MQIYGDMLLEAFSDNTFQLSKQAIVWRFTTEQLQAKIDKLNAELKEATDLLNTINAMAWKSDGVTE
jgi:hypothetical protein